MPIEKSDIKKGYSRTVLAYIILSGGLYLQEFRDRINENERALS